MISIVALLTTKFRAPDAVHGEAAFWQEHAREYVAKLFAGVTRHSGDADLSYFLMTDSPEWCCAGVTPLELPTPRSPGWWAKLAMFKPGFLPPAKTLYLDLDNVICGPLAPILALEPRPLYMADDILYSRMPNGSTMLCYPHQLEDLWLEYAEDPAGVRARYSTWPLAADQAFIGDRVTAPLLQDELPPGYLVNARCELEAGALPEHASIVFGSYHPKPHESLHPFYAEHWTL